MAGLGSSIRQALQEPFSQGFLLLLVLITLFLSKPLFSNQPLLAADLLFTLDPLWQPLAPAGFTAPANPVLSDQTFEFYGWQKFIRVELSQGRLPLWNPYVNSGHPFVGNAQSAIFDPFNLIALLWPLTKSFVVVAFLRLLCAGTFTLLLALALGLSRFAAYLAMVVFTFGGPQIVWLLYPKASVLVWLPAVLFLSLRLIRTGKWHTVAWLALVMAAQLVGGHPETALYSALLWLAFSSYSLWLERKATAQGHIPQRIVQLGSAGLLAVGVGAIQWLPVADALLQSEILGARSQPALTWPAVLAQWREWLAAVTMLLPDFFGNPRTHNYWYPTSNYTEQTLFVGVLPLALSLLVYFRGGKGRYVAFFAVLGVISLGLALRLPWFPLLAELPLLNVTNPGRLRGLYMLAVALLAGSGLDLVRQSLAHGETNGVQDDRRFTRLLLWLGVLAALVPIGALVLSLLFYEELVELGRTQAQIAHGSGNPFFFRPLEEYLTLAEVRIAQMQSSFLPSNWTMYLPLILALVMMGAGIAVRRWVQESQRAQVMSLVILAVVIGELWHFGLGYNPTIPPEQVFPTPALVDTLLAEDASGNGEPYRVVGTNLTLVPNVSMVFGLEDIRGYDPIALRRYMALMNKLKGAVRVGHHLLFTGANVPFFDFLNVRYAFTPHRLGGQWQLVDESSGVRLYANRGAMPRAFMVYASQITSAPAESLEMTLAPDFDFRHSVVLEGDAAPLASAPPALAPLVEMTRYVPGAMTVQVQTATDGLLVVSDPYTSGWVARVDGAVAEILIANHAFRAVRVPQGDHTITFDYRPMSFVVGAWSSGISVVTIMAVLLFGGSKRMSRPVPQRRRSEGAEMPTA